MLKVVPLFITLLAYASKSGKIEAVKKLYELGACFDKELNLFYFIENLKKPQLIESLNKAGIKICKPRSYIDTFFNRQPTENSNADTPWFGCIIL